MNIQLTNEKEKNKKLTNLLSEERNKIAILTKQLNEAKTPNNTLSQNNLKLKKEIEELKLKIQQSPKEAFSNSNNNNELLLYQKIDNLNETLKRYPVILEENEKLISIIFASSDQTMHYSMICKNTDTISDLEKKLYKEFPNFIDSDNVFLCNGTLVNKYKSFESYKIKNGDIIIVNKRDD